MSDYDYLLKIIVVGNSNVGKSSISSVLSNKGFATEYNTTIGVDFFAIRRKIEEIKWKLHIWDTAGQETFKSIIRTYYRQSAICFLVFDLTNRNTFNNLYSWKSEVLKENNYCFFVVLGNKADIVIKRDVSNKEATEWATANNMNYYEVSAKYNKFVSNNGIIDKDIITTIIKNFNNSENKYLNDGVKCNKKSRDCIEYIENRDFCCIIS